MTTYLRQYAKRIINHFPGIKRRLLAIRRALMNASGGVSTNYVEMNAQEAAGESSRLRAAWQADELPRLQRELVDRQLKNYRYGASIDVFDVMLQAMRALPDPAKGMAVLEIGCSSGFYSEVFDIAGLGVAYTGCDYSAAFIKLALEKYPALAFDIEDATRLSYPADAFDVAISGCCLLHIPEYRAAVAETARVARQYAIFHRTPVVLGRPDKYYRKQAYGVETVEIHFNEPQFLALLASCGLELIASYTLDEAVHDGVGSANRTYVCKKLPR